MFDELLPPLRSTMLAMVIEAGRARSRGQKPRMRFDGFDDEADVEVGNVCATPRYESVLEVLAKTTHVATHSLVSNLLLCDPKATARASASKFEHRRTSKSKPQPSEDGSRAGCAYGRRVHRKLKESITQLGVIAHGGPGASLLVHRQKRI